MARALPQPHGIKTPHQTRNTSNWKQLGTNYQSWGQPIEGSEPVRGLLPAARALPPPHPLKVMPPHPGCGMRDLGSRVGVQGSGSRVQGLGFRVQGAWCWVQGAGCMVLGSGFRVQGVGFRVHGSGFRVNGSWFRVQGSGFRIQRGLRATWGSSGAGRRVRTERVLALFPLYM